MRRFLAEVALLASVLGLVAVSGTAFAQGGAPVLACSGLGSSWAYSSKPSSCTQYTSPYPIRVRHAEIDMKKLVWTDWGAEEATAEGTWFYYRNFGAPSLQGPLSVKASRLVPSCGRPAYTRLTMERREAGENHDETLVDTIKVPPCAKTPSLKKVAAKRLSRVALNRSAVFWGRAIRRSLNCSRAKRNLVRCKARWISWVVAYGSRTKLRGTGKLRIRKGRQTTVVRGKATTGLVFNGRYDHKAGHAIYERF